MHFGDLHTPLINTRRRQALKTAIGAAASLALPALASSRRAMPSILDGPFYPPLSQRAQSLDGDADLTLVKNRGGDAAVARASRELLDLFGVVSDVDGRRVDGATVPRWKFGSAMCSAAAAIRAVRAARSMPRFRASAAARPTPETPADFAPSDLCRIQGARRTST